LQGALRSLIGFHRGYLDAGDNSFFLLIFNKNTIKTDYLKSIMSR
jgi:hypothetical protein